MSHEALQEAVDHLELLDVHYLELAAQRKEETLDRQPEDVEPSSGTAIQVALAAKQDRLLVRCRAVAENSQVRCVADIGGEFSIAEGFTLTREASLDFAEACGVMVVYPYLREAIHEMATKLRLPAPVLLLLRPGQIKLDRSTVEFHDDDDSTAAQPFTSKAQA